MRKGLETFTGLGKPIYDPLTTTTVGATTTRNQINCNGVPNVICPSRVDHFASLSLRYWRTFITRTAVPANFKHPFRLKLIDYDQFTIRIDHQIGSSTQLFGRWIYVNNRETDPNAAPLLKTASLTSNGQDIAVWPWPLRTSALGIKLQDFRIHYLPSHVRLSAFLRRPDFNRSEWHTGVCRIGNGLALEAHSWTMPLAATPRLQGSAFGSTSEIARSYCVRTNGQTSRC